MYERYILGAAICAYAAANIGFADTAAPTPSAPKQSFPSREIECFHPVDVCELLKQYAVLTHFKIIRDNFVSGKVGIDDLTGLPREKAIEIIERTLFADGYAIVQVDPDTVQIVGAGKNPRGEGVPVISDPKALPTHERVVSYVFRFKYRSAVEMQQQLGQYLSPPKSYTSFLAETKSNTVVITESTTVIRRLLEIVERVDVPDWEKEKKP